MNQRAGGLIGMWERGGALIEGIRDIPKKKATRSSEHFLFKGRGITGLRKRRKQLECLIIFW